MNDKSIDKIIKIVRQLGVIRPKDLDTHNIPRKYINLL